MHQHILIKGAFVLKKKKIMKQKKDFLVECNVCKHRLKNWVGSTPCCGSVAWLVENDKVTNIIIMYTENL